MKAIHLQFSKLNSSSGSASSGNSASSAKSSRFFNSFISILRRPVSSIGNKVLGLYSFKTLWRRSSTFSSVVLLILCGLIVVPIYNAVNNVEAATNEQTAPTLTVNVTNDTASLDLEVRNDSGTFASSSTSGSNATFTVATNNFTGYTLSIKSSSSSTDLTNTSTNPNSVLETIGSSMDSNTFDDENYNGKWGYLPSKYNSSTNTTTYYPSPNATGSTLDKTSSANSTANSYTIAIGARADYSKPTGTYSNTYILTTVINGFDYSISYNKGNTPDTVSNLPNTQTASAISDGSIILSSIEPTRSGYSFEGWCSIIPTTSSDADSCSGDVYQASDTFYFNKTTDNSNIALYAIWKKDDSCPKDCICYNPNSGTEITKLGNSNISSTLTLEVPDYRKEGYGFLGWSEDEDAANDIGTSIIYGPNETIDASNMGGTILYAIWLASVGDMQSWSGCPKLTKTNYNSSTGKITYSANTVVALTDNRDGNTYAIGKLADGSCWMIENLRLGGKEQMELSSASSQSAGAVMASTNQFEPTMNTAAYLVQHLNATNTLPNDTAHINNSRYLYGNYYSWAQAINSTTAFSSWSSSPTTTSICPTGWRLPLGGGTSNGYASSSPSQGKLVSSYGGNPNETMYANTSPSGADVSARFRSFPNNFVYSGRWHKSSYESLGANGSYWSTTVYSGDGAYYIVFNNASLFSIVVHGTGSKIYGFSVRCVKS